VRASAEPNTELSQGDENGRDGMTVGIQLLMSEMERLADCFHGAVYATPDLDAAVAVTAEDCVLVNVPMGTGARTQEDLRRHLVDQRRVVEEATVGFTHDRELPWLLPGVAATHRRAEVLVISVITFRHSSRRGVTDSRIATHRSLWDHSGLLAQLGIDPADVAAGRPAPV
jgi:carboxymethylenebutenolidase